jgi:plasmid replication initiation protein
MEKTKEIKTLENIENRFVVRKNKLVEGKVKLKAKSYDLIRGIASLVERDDTDFWTYQISVKSLDIDYTRAKEYIRDIMRNPIEIKDDVKKTFKAYAWCSTMIYENGVIKAKLNPDLKEFFLEIKGNYTKTFEKYILPMESVYAKRIYELLMQNKNYTGYRKFVLSELQEILNVPKSLKKYPDFKRRVLVTAINEINKHTDIYIPVNTKDSNDESWVRLQCGSKRKITHLNIPFLIKEDIKKQQEQMVSNEVDIGKTIEKSVDIEGMLYRFPEEIRSKMFGYYHMRLIEFVEWVRAENFRPRHNDWQTSFERHCDGYRKNLGKMDDTFV